MSGTETKNVQVRQVPERVHRELTRRAARAGQSLQQYLLDQLEALTATPMVDDVLALIEARDKGTLSGADAVAALAAERAGR